MAEPSLLDKAVRIQGLARAYAEGATERREREQVSIALTQVEHALSQLAASVQAARAAAALGIVIDNIAELAGSGLANLRARTGDGMLPSTRVLQIARGRLEANRSALDKALGAAWRTWSENQIRELPHMKKAFATRLSRQAIEEDIQTLARLAARKPSTAEEIASFVRVRNRVHHALDQLEGDDRVISILARLDSPEALTLADLSETELQHLRSHPDVAEQIELRRR